MLKRSKRLKEFFADLAPRDKEALKFCKSNWHFKVGMDSLLYTMVKAGEINKKFNSLNRKTAEKVEKYIKGNVLKHFEYGDTENRLKSNFIVLWASNLMGNRKFQRI